MLSYTVHSPDACSGETGSVKLRNLKLSLVLLHRWQGFKYSAIITASLVNLNL